MDAADCGGNEDAAGELSLQDGREEAVACPFGHCGDEVQRRCDRSPVCRRLGHGEEIAAASQV